MAPPRRRPVTAGPDLDRAERLRASVGAFVRRARAQDVTPPAQAAVLGHLARGGPMSIAELAAREQVRHQSTARTVGLLAAAGLVTVSPDEADRRRVVVRLSGTGSEQLLQAREQRAGWIARAAEAQLSEDEQALLWRVPELLERLAAHHEEG